MFTTDWFRVQEWTISTVARSVTETFIDGRWEAWDEGGITIYFNCESDAVMFAVIAGPSGLRKDINLQKEVLDKYFKFDMSKSCWFYVPLSSRSQ